MNAPDTAVVLWGANNIFQLATADGTLLSNVRLKGKVLEGAEDEYNPLAPGDEVRIERHDEARIVARLARRNRLTRWNRKGRALQTVAANIDMVVVVASLRSPAFRPRFIDRVLAMATLEEVPAIVVLTKADLVPAAETAAAMRRFADLGYPAYGSNVHSEADLAVLRAAMAVPRVVLFGQSGVGKSSLINRLAPHATLAVAAISDRFDRGRHTTTLARAVRWGGGTYLIDTPGVREFDLYQYETVEIAAGFIEMRPHLASCRLPSCTHTHEPGCNVRQALDQGLITTDRYDSYLRIIEELAARDGR